jgi:hypothetical protein
MRLIKSHCCDERNAGLDYEKAYEQPIVAGTGRAKRRHRRAAPGNVATVGAIMGWVVHRMAEATVGTLETGLACVAARY